MLNEYFHHPPLGPTPPPAQPSRVKSTASLCSASRRFVYKRKVKDWMNVIDGLIDSKSDDKDAFKSIKNRLKGMRAGAIEKGGESAPENLVFKELRNRGYLDKMSKYLRNLEDEDLSLY